MTAKDLMAKVMQAVASAKLLLDAGDADGACNRAYYAMFDAARAVMSVSGADVGKTHRGLINAFSERLVKNGPLPKEMGRFLKQAETIRYVADYEENAVQLSDAQPIVAQAETFVTAMYSVFMTENAKDADSGISP